MSQALLMLPIADSRWNWRCCSHPRRQGWRPWIIGWALPAPGRGGVFRNWLDAGLFAALWKPCVPQMGDVTRGDDGLSISGPTAGTSSTDGLFSYLTLVDSAVWYSCFCAIARQFKPFGYALAGTSRDSASSRGAGSIPTCCNGRLWRLGARMAGTCGRVGLSFQGQRLSKRLEIARQFRRA